MKPYLTSIWKVDKKDDIIKTLKNNDYARLEIELRKPYEHKIVIE